MRAATKENFDLLVTRYLSGEASGTERSQLLKFLKMPEWSIRFAELQRRWDAALAPPVGGFDLPAAAQRLRAALAEERVLRVSEAKNPRPAATRKTRRPFARGYGPARAH